jgi:hypothetical protein
MEGNSRRSEVTHSAGRKRSVGGASRMSLAGWVARLRYRSLGGAVPAAHPQPVAIILRLRAACLNHPKAPFFPVLGL